MPAIDWSNAGLQWILAGAGIVLVVLGVLFYFLPAARLRALALVVGIGGGLTAGVAVGLNLVPPPPSAVPERTVEAPPAEPLPRPAPPSTPGPIGKDGLDRFRQLSPAERMARIQRWPDAAAAWDTVQRGDVDSVVVRGALESADNAEIVVKVHARQKGGPAAKLKWVIDDGSMVKKGDLLAELDDAQLKEQLKLQQAALGLAKTALAQAEKVGEFEIEQAQLDVESARLQLAFAERERKSYTGSDAERKKDLELKVKLAQQRIKGCELQTTTTKTRTEATVRDNRATVELDSAQQKDLEVQLAACKMYAPRDGIVIHHIPPRVRFGAVKTIAAGEPVDEGQKLMYLPDLSKMQVDLRVHEAQIPFVRTGQTADVRVSAFPDRSLTGKVAEVSPVGQVQKDVKIYPVKVALADNPLSLKPGMDAEVRIHTTPRRNVLRVPAKALVRAGGETVCFVRSDDEVQERPVTLGLGADDLMEIRSGLTEGEAILRDPRAVARRLAGLGTKEPQPKR